MSIQIALPDGFVGRHNDIPSEVRVNLESNDLDFQRRLWCNTVGYRRYSETPSHDMLSKAP